MNINKLLLSYAEDFTSFLIKNISDLKNIKNIILFGSTARGEASKESDIDIFFELFTPDNKIQEELNKLKSDFFESARFKQYWSLLDVDNEFNALSGTFEEWKELKNSIIANGILLYGKFSAIPEAKNVMISSWEGIKPNSKRVFFNKKMFGYKQGKRQYFGLLQKYGGNKIGKGVTILPEEAKKELQELFNKFKVKSKTIKMMAYV